jgi:hypothetical protein
MKDLAGSRTKSNLFKLFINITNYSDLKLGLSPISVHLIIYEIPISLKFILTVNDNFWVFHIIIENKLLTHEDYKG